MKDSNPGLTPTLSNQKSVEDFLEESASGMVAIIAGLATTSKEEFILGAGRILQAGIRGNFLKQFTNEMKTLKEKGEIKNNWANIQANRTSFIELLNFIDSEIPDENRVEAMKRLFFKSIHPESTEADSVLHYQYMQIVKELSSSDILVLLAIHKLTLSDDLPRMNDRVEVTGWFRDVAKSAGHGVESLIESREENLMRLKLISKRTHSDLSGFSRTAYFRLTDLGHNICILIFNQK